MIWLDIQFFGRKGDYSDGGTAAASSRSGAVASESNPARSSAFTAEEEAVFIEGADYARRDWFADDEDWAIETDPEEVAQEIINFEERGRGWDDTIIDKMASYEGVHFEMNTPEQERAARSAAIKLQEQSDKHILERYPDVNAAYKKMKRAGR